MPPVSLAMIFGFFWPLENLWMQIVMDISETLNYTTHRLSSCSPGLPGLASILAPSATFLLSSFLNLTNFTAASFGKPPLHSPVAPAFSTTVCTPTDQSVGLVLQARFLRSVSKHPGKSSDANVLEFNQRIVDASCWVVRVFSRIFFGSAR